MVWLKSCPKCQGDLFQDHDGTAPVLTCLQCGRSLSAAQVHVLRNDLAARARQAVRSGVGRVPPGLPDEDAERPTVA
ncbi:MAG: hypothetical protein HY331_19230 [Chloroflexi bacterium]|nr:hypothetical protein [Chloroflexota bacterium]